jgi:nucleotide-binding universal stress UspA family protein
VLPPRQVLVAVDLSPTSAAALRLAVGFGGETEALLVFVPGVDRLSHMASDDLERTAQAALVEFVGRHAGPRAEQVRTLVRSGEARREILAEVKLRSPDLLVFGTHGPKALERLLIGSVAEHLADHASSSALVVPPEAALSMLEQAGARGGDWEFVSDEQRHGRETKARGACTRGSESAG